MGDNSGREVSAARAAGLPRYFTGRPCKHGHIVERITRTQNCVECQNARTRDRAKRNPSRVAAQLRAWRSRNSDRYRASRAKYLNDTRDRINTLARERRAKDAAAARARVRARQAGQRKRMPGWADAAAIRSIYVEAIRKSAELGIEHEVDHVIPLFGKTVSGLHVETNLQILTRSENARKGNRFAG